MAVARGSTKSAWTVNNIVYLQTVDILEGKYDEFGLTIIQIWDGHPEY